MVEAIAEVVTDELGGDWRRISQSTEEGPGAEDSLANARVYAIRAGNRQWRYPLDGSNLAFDAMWACRDRYLK
jgi:hypothetical protein